MILDGHLPTVCNLQHCLPVLYISGICASDHCILPVPHMQPCLLGLPARLAEMHPVHPAVIYQRLAAHSCIDTMPNSGASDTEHISAAVWLNQMLTTYFARDQSVEMLHRLLTARCNWTSGSSRVMHSAISLSAKPNVISTEASRGLISSTWSHLSMALEYSLIASCMQRG